MTRFFERVTYDAISDSNRDFAVSVNAMTETLNSSMVNFERQLFYSNTVSTLFREGRLYRGREILHYAGFKQLLKCG